MNGNNISTVSSSNIANYSIYSKGLNKSHLYSTKTTDKPTNVNFTDKVEISREAKLLYATASTSKSSNAKGKSEKELMDTAKSVFDIVTDFIPGVGTAKDIYNLYKTITKPKSTAADIGWAIADLVPGPSLPKIKKLAQTVISKFDLNKSSTQKLNASLKNAYSKKIKDMSITDTQTLIRKSEATKVGHAKRDHLDISDTDLKIRAKTEKKIATKFSNGDAMKQFVNYTMGKNADKIASWLNGNSKGSLTLNENSNKIIGHGFEYNSKTKGYKDYKNIQKGTMVLIKDDSNEYGFTLLTAYPKAK